MPDFKNSVLFYFREAFIHVQNLDRFEIAMERELSLVFLVLLIAALRAIEFFFPVRIYSSRKNLGCSKMFLFGEVEKLPLDLILPPIIVHIVYCIRDDRAELLLKYSSGN